ncbi:hypothetical protein QHH11_25800 [Aphanizomenon sp. PH219]|nr:hypothetical protein [Aphanizomenon sp. 202]MDK2462490.1 hypothetical protein [Aphanizomenon sp. PH219]
MVGKKAQSHSKLSTPATCVEEFYNYKVIGELLSPGNPHGLYLIAWSASLIQKFHLQTVVEPIDLIHDAFLRGVKTLESGTSIKYPLAWCRGTIYNVVREKSRIS